MTHSPTLLWARHAWLEGRWERGVCLQSDASGRWTSIEAGIHTAPEMATVLNGPVLPGMVNAHSHAFQRAFAGLSERRVVDSDDFWSWRDRMYGVALRITPTQMQSVAAQLYVEMLQGGYTQVCEFHYIHHAESGAPYADPSTMAWAVADGAADAGLGLTVLPVLYERAGFAQAALRVDQRRFASDAQNVHRIRKAVSESGRAMLQAGVAIHSLRAAPEGSIDSLLATVASEDVPIHIHVAEQMQEVHDCLKATGKRPIQWLCDRHAPDARWQLVHATHAQSTEIDAVARSGAGIVLCPSTEGNLGDGLPDLPAWLQAGVPMAIGSDSHVSRQWPEELRWLEYGQRALLQRRNVAASPSLYYGSTAARLLQSMLSSGGKAAGNALWGLQTGARADALVVDPHTPGMLGIPTEQTLDALVFATGGVAFKDVYVAGKQVISGGRHAAQSRIAERFETTMDALWGD